MKIPSKSFGIEAKFVKYSKICHRQMISFAKIDIFKRKKCKNFRILILTNIFRKNLTFVAALNGPGLFSVIRMEIKIFMHCLIQLMIMAMITRAEQPLCYSGLLQLL